MKKSKVISLILAAAIALALAAPAIAGPTPSSWALKHTTGAAVTGLLTHSAAKDYQAAMTRDEFCELVIGMVEQTLGQTLFIPEENPFTDTDSDYVQKAALYGIVNGVSEDKFAPDNTLERQQLCTMIVRAIRKLEAEFDAELLKPAPDTLEYNDVDSIAEYALESIKYAYSSNIMIGDDKKNFNPTARISAEECVAVIIRTFDSIERTISAGKTTAELLDMAERRLHVGYAYGDSADGVSQDVLLETSGTGKTVITWQSSDTDVISVGEPAYDGATALRGEVTVGQSPQSVTLTATLTLDGESRTKSFTLNTSTSSGDKLLVENAAAALEISYLTPGDSADSVTGRLSLPAKIFGLPVIWSTTDSGAVTVTGAVRIPADHEPKEVTLTASITSGTETKTKTFPLTVINPEQSRVVSLHGVELGMTTAQAAEILGAEKTIVRTGTDEVWHLYHNDYKNFIAVAFISDKAAAIYSMADSAAQQLKNSAGDVITAAQANSFTGYDAALYTDSDGAQYAIMLSARDSAIGTSRQLTESAQETLLLELVNAVRAKNNLAPLEWNETLAAASREHSAEMREFDYVDATSSKGAGTLKERSAAHGFDSTRYMGGNVLAGSVDAFAFLSKLMETQAMRTELMQTSAAELGAGFAFGGTGDYATYFTYIIGNVSWIASVEVYQDSQQVKTAAVGTGVSQVVTLNVAPADKVEPFSVTSSNTKIMTLTNDDKTVTLTGVANGSADIVVKGQYSGKSFTIPVKVATVYATGLTISSGTTTLKSGAQSGASSHTLVMGTNDKLTITATPNVQGAAVTWTRTGGSAAAVTNLGNDAVITSGTSTGSVTLTAKVAVSASSSITYTVTVEVVSASLSPAAAATLDLGESLPLSMTVGGITGVAPKYSWVSSNPSAAPITGGDSPAATLTALKNGTTEVTATVTYSGTHIGSIKKTVTVTIYGEADYAKNFSINPTLITLSVNSAPVAVTVTTDPEAVRHNAITWTSSNTAVATVSAAGVVTPVSSGSTTITAVMTVSEAGATLTRTAEVLVVPSISINGGSRILSVSNSATLTYTLSPSTALPAGFTVKWSSSNPTVAAINTQQGFLSAVNAGTAEITVALLYNGETVSQSTPITITVNNAVG